MWIGSRKPKKRNYPSTKKKKHPWYDKSIWRYTLRPQHLKISPYCEECAKKGKYITQRVHVDHKIPWKSGKTERERWILFTQGELTTLCQSHHNKKTRQDEKKYTLYE